VHYLSFDILSFPRKDLYPRISLDFRNFALRYFRYIEFCNFPAIIMVRGKVQIWNEARGFGFLEPSEPDPDGESADDLFFHISEVNSDRTPSPGLIALYEKVYNPDKGKFQAVNVRFTGEREEVFQRVKGWRWHREERRRIARLPCTCGEGDFDMDMCRACWNRDQD